MGKEQRDDMCEHSGSIFPSAHGSAGSKVSYVSLDYMVGM